MNLLLFKCLVATHTHPTPCQESRAQKARIPMCRICWVPLGSGSWGQLSPCSQGEKVNRGCGNHPGLERFGPPASHPGAREVGDESEAQGEPHMFPMTRTLFPATETNRHEIHIWDPPPAWPFPLPPGTEPSLCAIMGAQGQVASRAPTRLLPTSPLLMAFWKSRLLSKNLPGGGEGKDNPS